MAAQHRKLEVLTFTLGGIEFQDQVTTLVIENNTDDAEVKYTFGGDAASFAEAAEDSFALSLTMYSDWRSNGISDYLWSHDGETVACQIDHLEDYTGEHVRFAGSLQLKAPNVGGEVRTSETTETTLTWVGRPTYTRP